jgi:hypothetical protein
LSNAITNELWKRGQLSWKFHAGQSVIEDNFNRVAQMVFVGNCSRRFGKTFWAAVKCAEKAITLPNARVKIATAFQKDLEEFIVPTFDLVFSDVPDKLRPTWVASKKKYRFKNGSEIQLVGLDKNPNAGRGNYCDLYVFEEAAYISNLSKLYSSVVVPMTAKRINARIIMISTPSDEDSSEFQLFCQKAQQEKAYVELTIYQNPMLSPEEIEKLHRECLSEDDWEREYLCKFVVSKNKSVIPEFQDESIKVTPKDEFYQYFHRYGSMDMGVLDKTVVLFGYYDFRRAKLVVEGEYVRARASMTTDELALSIKEKEAQLWPNLSVHARIADSNNPQMLIDLSANSGLAFFPTNKETLDAMVNEVRLWFKQSRVEIHPDCTELIGNLKYGVWAKNRREFGRSKIWGHYDALASLVYLIRNIDQLTNPIPITHNTTYDHFVPQDAEQSQTVRELKKLFG